MAISDLLMQIKIAVVGDNGSSIKSLQDKLGGLRSTLNDLQSVKLAGLNSELGKLRSALAETRNIDLGVLPTQLAGFKKSLEESRTATATLNTAIRAISQNNRDIKLFDVSRLRDNIRTIKEDLASTKQANFTPLQNNFRSISNDVLRTQNTIRSLREDLRALTASNKQSGIEGVTRSGFNVNDLKRELQSAEKELSGYKNALSNSRIALNEEANAHANRALAAAKNIKSNQDLIRTEEGKIAAGERLISNLRKQLLLEEQKATAAKSGISLTQQQIKAINDQAKSNANAIRQQIADKQKEIAATKEEINNTKARIASAQEDVNASRARAVATRSLRESITGLVPGLRLVTNASKQFFAAFSFMLGPQMAGFAAAAGITAMAHAFFNANKSSEQLIRGLNAISNGQGRAEFLAMQTTADRLGVSIENVAHSYLQLEASAAGTRLEGAETRRIFTALSNALQITGASTVSVERGFRAVSQMISKGQIYAEELKGQLAEALPGAIQVFARALDVTPQKLLALMKQGLVSSDALILFAKQLEKEYKIVDQASFTLAQKVNLLKNAFYQLSVKIGETGVWNAFGDVILKLRDYLKAAVDGFDGFTATVSSEWSLIKTLYGDGAQSIANSFKSIIPDINLTWEDIKSGLLDFPVELNKTVETTIGEIRKLAIDAQNIIKNVTGSDVNLESQLSVIGVATPGELLKQQLESLTGRKLDITTLFTMSREGIKLLSGEVQSALVEASQPKDKPFQIHIQPVIDEETFNKKLEALKEANKSPIFNLFGKRGVDLGEEKTFADYPEYISFLNYKNAAIDQTNKLIDEENKKNRELFNLSQQQKNTIDAETQSRLQQADAAKAKRDADIESARIQGIINKYNESTSVAYSDTARFIEEANSRKTQQLKITKEQINKEKEIQDIQQQQSDILAQIADKKRAQRVKEGLITQDEADAEKQRSIWQAAYDANKKAQQAVEDYNTELAKGDKSNEDKLKLLSKISDDQLKFAIEKAKEYGDEYKITQLSAQRIQLREQEIEQAKKISDNINSITPSVNYDDAKIKENTSNAVGVAKEEAKKPENTIEFQGTVKVIPPDRDTTNAAAETIKSSYNGSFSNIISNYRSTTQFIQQQPITITVKDDEVADKIQQIHELANLTNQPVRITTKLIDNGTTQLEIVPIVQRQSITRTVADIHDRVQSLSNQNPVNVPITTDLQSASTVIDGVSKTVDAAQQNTNTNPVVLGIVSDKKNIQLTLDDIKKYTETKSIEVPLATSQQTLVRGADESIDAFQQRINERMEELKTKGYTVDVQPTITGGVTADGWIKQQFEGAVLTISTTANTDGVKKQLSDVQEQLKNTPLTAWFTYKATNPEVIGDSFNYGSTSSPPGYSSGTILGGYGGGDRIRALLESGEAVIPKDQVARNRRLVEALVYNRPVPNVEIPKLSNGGIIGTAGTMNLNISIGGKNYRLQGARDQVGGFVDAMTKVARAL